MLPATDLLKRGRVPMDEVLTLFDQACAGVQRAHRDGVLHRDLKPPNLLLRKSGTLVVADFGLCRIDASEFSTVTAMNVGGGTWRYAAPEQWINLHRADHRADVFSLGVILQDLLVGSAATAIGDAAELTKVGADSFSSVIARATHSDPAKRYASVVALRRAAAEAQTRTVRRRLPRGRG